jgi:hypothetical protein
MFRVIAERVALKELRGKRRWKMRPLKLNRRLFVATSLARNPRVLYMYDRGTKPCSRYAYPMP